MNTDDAIGYWDSIFEQLGIDVGGNKHGPCPICGGKDRYRYDNKDGRGTYFCNQCGPGDGFAMIMKKFGIDFKGAMEKVEQIICSGAKKTPINDSNRYDPKRLRELYKNSAPLTGDCLGSLYLKNRGLSIFPKTLRYIRECWEPATRKKMPALLATFSAPDSEALTLQRIYLTLSGNKADLDHPKLTMTPKRQMSGGAVRIFEQADKIGIAEGIETAIACYEVTKIPTWATLSTSLMQGFVPPPGVKEVVVFADNDHNYAGQKAAYTLANRLKLKNYEVSVEVPLLSGTDFLDEFVTSERDGQATSKG